MPNSVLLDTNGWLALLHAKDVNHEQAEGIWLDLGLRGYNVVLTDWIIAKLEMAWHARESDTSSRMRLIESGQAPKLRW